MFENVTSETLYNVLKSLHRRLDQVADDVAEIRVDIRGLKAQNAATMQWLAGAMHSLAAQNHSFAVAPDH